MPPIKSHAAFHCEILNDLDNDEPRLVYADWLTEQGDPYGDFIRMEVAWTRGQEDGQQDYADALQRLFDRYEQEWFGPLYALGIRYVWPSRGFVEELFLPSPQLLTDRTDELFAAAPLLTQIDFDLPDEGELDSNDGDHEDHIGSITDDHQVDVARLAGMPQLQQVRSLALSHCHIPIDELPLLVNSPNLTSLQELALSVDHVDRQGEVSEIIATSRVLPQLAGLDITAGLDPDGLKTLLLNPLPGLRSLSLAVNQLSAEALDTIARQTPHLTDLSLSFNDIGAEGVRRLLRAPFISNLERLTLTGCRLDDEALELLAAAPLDSLEYLAVAENFTRDLRPLLASSRLPNLSWLSVSAMNHESAEALCRWNDRLEWLHLDCGDSAYAGITEEDVDMLRHAFAEDVLDYTAPYLMD